MSELQEMQDAPTEAVEIHDLDFQKRLRRVSFTTREVGASKQWHADCPCCGTRFAVDHTEGEQSMLDRAEQTLRRRTRDKIQAYFTECWKWKTREREFNTDAGPGTGPNKSRGVSSSSIEMVVQTGVGKALRRNWRDAVRKGWRTWFAVLWHDVPVIGENFFCCRLADLFAVLQGIADDSPEFAYRLRTAADNALKRDGSAARGGRDGQVSTQRRERRGEGFDPRGAVDL